MTKMETINSPYEAYRQQSYFQSLDGVRFFSIIAVIWHHSFPEGTSAWLTKGFLGVDMFFVLSGYLIVTLLLREKEKGNINLKNFYIRRSLRIFPVYFGLLFALLFMYGVLKEDKQEFNQLVSLMPVYLFFLSNWSVVHFHNLEIYWSLATEEQFYFIWPLIQKIFSWRIVFCILAVFIFLNQLVNFGVLDSVLVGLYGTKEVLKLSIVDSTFTPICLGVLLAHLLHKKPYFLAAFAVLKNRLSPLVILFSLLFVIFTSPADIAGVARFSIQTLMMLWLASLVIRENHSLQPMMQFYPVKRIGQVSYGMYVYHMFAIHIARVLIERLGISFDYILFFVASVLTFVIAEASFRYYEMPILKLKRHFS